MEVGDKIWVPYDDYTYGEWTTFNVCHTITTINLDGTFKAGGFTSLTEDDVELLTEQECEKYKDCDIM